MSQRGNAQHRKKQGNKGSNSSQSSADELLDDILSNVDDKHSSKLNGLAEELAAILLPAISTTISKAIEEKSVTKEAFEKSKCNIRLNKYENDKLEQYTRRENIRIFNYAGEENMSLADSVTSLLNDMVKANGHESQTCFKVEDISVCHRLGKKEAGSVDTRPIIVRFVSRQSVQQVFKYKKNLKSMEKYKGLAGKKSVYITEDLTQLRVRMRDVIKKHSGVTDVYTREGNIYGTKDGRKFMVCSPDDLFKIGIDVDLTDLKLESYM